MKLDFIKESIRDSVQNAIRTQVNEDYALTDAEEAIITEAMTVYGPDFVQLDETIKGRIASGTGKLVATLGALATVITTAMMSTSISGQLMTLASTGAVGNAVAIGAMAFPILIAVGTVALLGTLMVYKGSEEIGKALDVKTYNRLEKKLERNIQKRDALISKVIKEVEEFDSAGSDYNETIYIEFDTSTKNAINKLTKQQQKIGKQMVKILDKNYDSIKSIAPDVELAPIVATAVGAAEGKLTTIDALATKKVKK